MKRSTKIAATLGAAAVAAALFISTGSRSSGRDAADTGPGDSAATAGRDDATETKARRRRPADAAGKPARPARTGATPARRAASEISDDGDEQPTLSDLLDEAASSEDSKKTFALAARALAEGDEETKEAAIQALAAFGADALPELVPFMADASEAVRESAMNEWTNALSGIEDDALRISAAELAMAALADDDILETVSTEYIGIDEKLAVESLLKIIEEASGTKGAEKAKETYEFVTGEEFASREAAEKWIAEEYTPEKPEAGTK